MSMRWIGYGSIVWASSAGTTAVSTVTVASLNTTGNPGATVQSSARLQRPAVG